MSSPSCLRAHRNTLCSSPSPDNLFLGSHKKGLCTPEMSGCPGTGCLGCDPAEVHVFHFSQAKQAFHSHSTPSRWECTALREYAYQSVHLRSSPPRPTRTCPTIKVSDISRCPRTKQLPALSGKLTKASLYPQLTHPPGKAALPRWPPLGLRSCPQCKAGQRLQAKGQGCGEENERAGTKDKEERHLERWALPAERAWYCYSEGDTEHVRFCFPIWKGTKRTNKPLSGTRE